MSDSDGTTVRIEVTWTETSTHRAVVWVPEPVVADPGAVLASAIDQPTSSREATHACDLLTARQLG